MDFAEKLQSLMDERGLSRYALGQEIDVRTSTISGWLDENRKPRAATLKRMADYFGVDVDYLRGTTDVRNSFISSIADALGASPDATYQAAGANMSKLQYGNQAFLEEFVKDYFRKMSMQRTLAHEIIRDGYLILSFNPTKLTDSDLQIFLVLAQKIDEPGVDKFIEGLKNEINRRKE